MKAFADLDKTSIVEEVTDSFTQLVVEINQKNIAGWERYYSRDEFTSAVTGGTIFVTRSDWVKAMTNNFAMRKQQHLELQEVQVLPLTLDTAMLTSQEKVDMQLTSGQNFSFKHVFTIIWKKEQNGWKILHSHESWIEETDQ